MGLMDDFAKGFLLFTILLWVLAIFGSLVSGQTTLALLLLIVLIVPVSMIAWEYLENRKKATLRPAGH